MFTHSLLAAHIEQSARSSTQGWVVVRLVGEGVALTVLLELGVVRGVVEGVVGVVALVEGVVI